MAIRFSHRPILRKIEKTSESADKRTVESLGTLFQCLDAECARARRFAGCFAVLHCSLEGLPAVSRSRERVLAALGQDGREYDFCVPAGDDIVLVLPEFRPADLAPKRARLERLLEQAALEVGLPLRVRIGAAFFPDDCADAEDLLAAAHAAQS
jgi:hypothetical protein